MACASCSETLDAPGGGIDPDQSSVLTDLTDFQLLWIAVIVLGVGVVVALNK